jgi:tyrosine-protein kinase Etk/Wzc
MEVGMPQYELNLRDYWQIIRRRYVVVISVFFTVLILSVIYTSVQRPVYQAIASIEWVERRTVGDLLTELVTVSYGNPLETQARVITSLTVMEKVAMELGFVDDKATADEIMQQARALQAAVSTDIVTRTNLIRIIVTYKEPRMAADVANKVAEVYITENLKTKTKQSRSVREFIEEQLKEVKIKLHKSEEILARFKEVEVPSGVALSLEQRLAALEAKRADLLRIYTPLHPDVKNIGEQIRQAKKQLKTLPQKELEYSRLTREVEINSKLYRELKDKLAAARIAEAEKISDVHLISRAVIPAAPISPNKTLNYLLGAMIGLMLGFSGAFLSEQLDTSIGTIEDVESFLELPALGVIPYLKTKGEERQSLMRRLWPRQSKGEERVRRLKNQLLIHYSSSSPTFEAYRMLKTNILTEFKNKPGPKTLLFSSSGPEEGKSITAANLSIVMAQGGLRTLLIDADMRRSVVHKIFGFSKKEPGLCEILQKTATSEGAIRMLTDMLLGEIGFDEVLKIPGLDNLHILTAGSSPSIPTELLSSSEMDSLLAELKTKFDIILLDSPPVLAVADSLIMAPKADGVILVYRVGRTARSVLSRSKMQLIESGAEIKGVVLNNISPQMEMRYGYYYHYKYYGKYYTRGGGKERKTQG